MFLNGPPCGLRFHLFQEIYKMHRKPIPGWRSFFCDCGYSWTSAVRDWLSPSLEPCPRCYEEVFPKAEGPDPSLKVDSSGNVSGKTITPAIR